MPRDPHTTGDILVYEMAYGNNDELWVVNTRFSCLCTLDKINSFVPLETQLHQRLFPRWSLPSQWPWHG
jgi:hypothetical protein